MDIANHILATEGMDRGETYSSMFQKLSEGKIIGKDLADRLSMMAKFRNLLVHRYTEIDNERVYEIAQKI